MVLLALLVGVTVVLVIAKLTRWFEIALLVPLGILIGQVSAGRPVVSALTGLSSWMDGWFT